MSWSWKSSLDLADSDESAWTPYSVSDMIKLETGWTAASRLKPVLLSSEYSVNLRSMIQYRNDVRIQSLTMFSPYAGGSWWNDPSRERPVRRLDTATQTAPRVKVTKRKADSDTETSRSEPKRAKPNQKSSTYSSTAASSDPASSIFHTIDHIMLKEWVYDDAGSGSNGLDEEMKVESSPAYSRLKLDFETEVASSSLLAFKKARSIYAVMKRHLLWYWGDSDCNWWPFLIETSVAKSSGTNSITSIILDSLGLSQGTDVFCEDISKKEDLFDFDKEKSTAEARRGATALLKSTDANAGPVLTSFFRVKVDPNNRAPINYPMFVGGISSDRKYLIGLYVLCSGETD